MEKFFDYEETEDEKKVKFAFTKLKGYVALLWDGVQAERRRQLRIGTNSSNSG